MVSQPTREPTVRVRGLHHAFGIEPNRKRVLHDNNLDLVPGEIVIMTGPSGSGKTTERSGPCRKAASSPLVASYAT